MSGQQIASLKSKTIMRDLKERPGTKVGGYNINNQHYKVGTVLIAENDKDLQQMLDTVVVDSEKKRLAFEN